MEASVDFVWDEKKRLLNLRKHGIDFADCAQLFRGPLVTWPDSRFDYGEERHVAVGLIRDRVIVAAFTVFRDAIRVISMRKASKHEEASYFENLSRLEDGLEASTSTA
jgi:uncharacterized DUF497 family protein